MSLKPVLTDEGKKDFLYKENKTSLINDSVQVQQELVSN